jgi:hypothetical protein
LSVRGWFLRPVAWSLMVLGWISQLLWLHGSGLPWSRALIRLLRTGEVFVGGMRAIVMPRGLLVARLTWEVWPGWMAPGD